MKVCIVSYEFDTGAGIYIAYLLKYLAQKAEIHLITPTVNPLTEEFLNDIYVHYVKCATKFIFSIESILFNRSVTKKLAKLNPDITLVNSTAYTIFSFPYPTIGIGHGNLLSASLSTNILYPGIPLEFLSCHYLDYIIAVSSFIKKEITKRYMYPSKRIIVIPNGVDTNCFSPKVDGSDLRDKLGKNNIILYVGFLNKSKGIDTLLKTAKLIPEGNFIVVGGGSLQWRRYVEDFAKKTKNLFYLGYIPHNEIPKYYAASDICVVPSLYESFGMVVLEAMASQKPIIASNVGGIPEVLGDSGVLFKAKDYFDLAKKIRALLSNCHLAEEYAEKARDRSLSFDWSVIAERVYKFLENSIA